MTSVGLGHVGAIGGVPVAAEAAQVRGDAPGREEDLDRARRGPDVHLLAHQLVGHRVVVVVRLDVVVDVDRGLLPGSEPVAGGRQRAQGGAIECFEEALPRPVHLLERPGVDLLDTARDGGVDLGDRKEALPAEPGDDPALGQQHAGFDLGLVPGLVGAGRDDRHAVMGGHLLVGGVDVGLVTVRASHP
jgi:hypothetical protein